MEKIRICVLGSGNLATALGKILALNAVILPDVDNLVQMFVQDELFEGMRLNAIINSHHVNAKYLPMLELPANLVASTDLVATAKYADIIVFVMPQQCVRETCNILLGKIKPNAMAISVVKGFMLTENGEIELITQAIERFLKIPCAVLVGVNMASEVTLDNYCEATLGYRDMKHMKLFKDLFSTPKFRVTVIDDADGVEVCGYLKHIIAFASGLLDGLEANENTKSACLQFGLVEMMRFIDVFYPGCKLSTFFESCGIADVMSVSCRSRNRRLGELVVKTGHTVEYLESKLMGGEKVVGPITIKAVNTMLQQKGLQKKFPLFSMLYKMCTNECKPDDLLECIATMPKTM